MHPAYLEASKLARESYSRLLAFLAVRCKDLALVEDALSDAFVSALKTWPERGIPDKPEHWLLAVARNRLRDQHRRTSVSESALLLLQQTAQSLGDTGPTVFPDERLKLLFVCAHPAIEVGLRAPLMLQVVLGLDANRISRAFLVSPYAMSKRLSRCKAKIAAANIPFAVPEASDLPARLEPVLEAIYAAFGLAWGDIELQQEGLADEAIWLMRMLLSLLPGQAEAHGLLALMLHSEARRAARRDERGIFVPLSEQDTAKWSLSAQAEAEGHLRAAATLSGGIGPFQIEAAIQSAHASRARNGCIPWRDIAGLYDALVRMRPSLGSLVARAAAHGQANGPGHGLQVLEETRSYKARFHYQPYWACRAHLSTQLGELKEAEAAFGRAIELTADGSLRQYLEGQRGRLEKL